MSYDTFRRVYETVQRVNGTIITTILALCGVAIGSLVLSQCVNPAASADSHYMPATQPYDSKTKNWSVWSEHDGVTHKGCVAERKINKSVKVRIRVTSAGVPSAILDGVSFGGAEDTFGVIRIDERKPQQVYVMSRTEFVTEFSPPKDETFLQQLSGGGTMTVLIGKVKYVVNLAETAAVIKELGSCNTDGQSVVDNLRIKLATTAKEKVVF